jgi:hypothetical protein
MQIKYLDDFQDIIYKEVILNQYNCFKVVFSCITLFIYGKELYI